MTPILTTLLQNIPLLHHLPFLHPSPSPKNPLPFTIDHSTPPQLLLHNPPFPSLSQHLNDHIHISHSGLPLATLPDLAPPSCVLPHQIKSNAPIHDLRCCIPHKPPSPLHEALMHAQTELLAQQLLHQKLHAKYNRNLHLFNQHRAHLADTHQYSEVIAQLHDDDNLLRENILYAGEVKIQYDNEADNLRSHLAVYRARESDLRKRIDELENGNEDARPLMPCDSTGTRVWRSNKLKCSSAVSRGR